MTQNKIQMSIGIVGTSHLSEAEAIDARKMISFILKDLSRDIIIITGDANGIDKLVSEVAFEQGFAVIVFNSEVKNWDDVKGKIGFKSRNIAIAKRSNEVYCITTMIKKKACYHCEKQDHEKTGGCYTVRVAKSLGKHTKVIVI